MGKPSELPKLLANLRPRSGFLVTHSRTFCASPPAVSNKSIRNFKCPVAAQQAVAMPEVQQMQIYRITLRRHEPQFTANSCSARLTDVFTISTFVPTGTVLKTRTMSRERMRMQP